MGSGAGEGAIGHYGTAGSDEYSAPHTTRPAGNGGPIRRRGAARLRMPVATGMPNRGDRMRPVAIVALTIALALAIAACGESAESAETTPAPTPSPAPSPDQPSEEPTIKQYADYPPMTIDATKSYTAVMVTNLGEMKFKLLPTEAPLAVNNFVFLVREGYYDGVVFHRVIPGFMAQSGDPSGTGSGGPGYSFEIESPQRPYLRGVLAMANRMSPDTNGSQFFIVFDDLTNRLDPNFTLFGEMTEGDATLAAIEAVPVSVGPSGERSAPQQEIVITKIEVHEQ